MNSSEYRYFVREGDYYPFLITNKKDDDSKGGTFFDKGANAYSSFSPEFNFKYALKRVSGGDFKETILPDILKRINNKERQIRLLSFLGIDKILDENVPEEQAAKIINKLKNSRAFNEDSALKLDGEDNETAFMLSLNGKIKEFCGRFFV